MGLQTVAGHGAKEDTPPVTGAEGLEAGNPLLVRLTGKSLLHVPQDGGWRGEIPSWEAEMRGHVPRTEPALGVSSSFSGLACELLGGKQTTRCSPRCEWINYRITTPYSLPSSLCFWLLDSHRAQARSSTFLLGGLQASGPGSGWGDKWPLRACAALTFPGPRQVCPGVPALMLC